MIETVRQFGQEHKGMRNAAIAAGVGVGLYALYNAVKPERHYDTGENYFDIIRGFNQTVIDAVGEDVGYVMMGGGASAALMHPETVIDVENRRIKPPANIHKDQFREDNGSMADIDVLVFAIDTKDEEDITEVDNVREALEARYGSKLKIGVTGLHAAENQDIEPTTLTQKLLKNIKKDWVSDRVENVNGERFVTIADIKVALPDEYFEPWEMELTNEEDGSTEVIPVFHPLIQILCYLSRACHGIRPRDIPKVIDGMDNIGSIFGAKLVFGEKQQTASLELTDPVDDGVHAAIDFAEQKNNLRRRETKKRMSETQAALLAARIAIHRQLDTRKFTIQFGQGGWIFDNFISKISGEKQQPIKSKRSSVPVENVA